MSKGLTAIIPGKRGDWGVWDIGPRTHWKVEIRSTKKQPKEGQQQATENDLRRNLDAETEK